jgi:enamine deaminase RidA (YjgF/YER057c/UK114 family)
MTARNHERSTMHESIHPEGWKPALGYANAVAASGRTIFLSGQIGWNADQMFETDDFVGQVEQTLRNIRAILQHAGCSPRHLVRLTWFVTDKRAYLENQRAIGTSYREIIGRHFPAMSVVEVSSLLEDRAKVEIEATAVLPEA